MMDTQFDIYLLGDIQPGLVRSQVVANLARVFKREPAAVEAMLSKPRSLIKRGLDDTKARQYQKVISDAGGLCELVAVTPELSLLDEPALAAPSVEPPVVGRPTPPPVASPYATPSSVSSTDGGAYCFRCGTALNPGAVRCHKCGANQPQFTSKDKALAGALAFLCGGLGVHRFYLGQWWGIFYLIFWGTLIPSIISVIEAIVFWMTSRENWDRKYGRVPKAGAGSAVVIVVCLFAAIAFIGILAAVALPAYQDYTHRTQVAQGMTEIGQARQQIESFARREGRYPRGAGELTLPQPSGEQGLIGLELQEEGKLVANYKLGVGESTILWIPSRQGDQFEWSCTGGTMANKSRPSVCRDPNQPTTSSGGVKRLHSTDRTFSLEVPSSWRENNTLNDDASLGAANLRQEGYVVVIEDPLADFDEPPSLEDYAELILGNMAGNIDNAQYAGDLNPLVIDGWPAYQRVLQGSVDNIKVTYLITLVEREESLYQIICWTLSSRFNNKEGDLRAIASSFRTQQ